MYPGIAVGLLAALLQSCSYIFSRHFMVRHGNPFHLLIYSQLVMGVLGGIALAIVAPPGIFHGPHMAPMLLCALCYIIGQGCFFITLRQLEASRASSLLGIKIIILALINIAFFGIRLNAQQWFAAAVCAAAAVMINYSGGRITWKGCFWLLMSCVGYSLSDIFGREAVLRIPVDDFFIRVMAFNGLCYLTLGLAAIPALPFIKRSRRAFANAVPFALCWFAAMIFLFACFASLGTVFGNIVQATRGLMSVLIGLVLVRMGLLHLEGRVSVAVFLRRCAAAAMMLLAIILFATA